MELLMPTRIHRLLCLLSVATFTAQAGVVLETRETDLPAGSERGTNTLRVDDGRLRLERYEGGALVGIMIFKDDALHALDPAEKRYAVLDRATVQKVADVVNPALKELGAQLQKMSPEQRAMVEQMLPGSASSSGPAQTEPKREVRRTERTDNVAGLGCRIYEVLENSSVVREACVAPATAVPGGQDFYSALTKMGALMQDLLDAIEAPWVRETIDDQWATVSQFGGVPVRSREFQGGKPVLEIVLTSIAEQAAPPGSFDIPSDYTRRDLEAL
jgi:hypothetical protein